MGTRLGVILAAAVLAGCAGSGATQPQQTGGVPPTQAQSLRNSRQPSSSNQYVFVSNDLAVGGGQPAEIDFWPTGTTGDVAPSVIGGSNTGLFYGLEGVVVNSGGEIFVNSSIAGPAILGFPPNSIGNVSPNVTISGSNTGLAQPIGLALDSAGNLYVANCGAACENGQSGAPSIEEFAATSNGNVAPIRTIIGKRTQLVAPFGIAVAANGDIYVVDIGGLPPVRSSRLSEPFPDAKSAASQIDVFSASANGNRAPKRVIAGANTRLSQPLGIGLNASGFYVGSWNESSISRFSPRASGDARPRSQIKGSATQLECCLDGIITAPDASVYAVVRGSGNALPEIVQFSGLARGNVAPLTNITGPDTRLYVPLFVFVGGATS